MIFIKKFLIKAFLIASVFEKVLSFIVDTKGAFNCNEVLKAVEKFKIICINYNKKHYFIRTFLHIEKL